MFALPSGRVSLISYLIIVYLWLCWVFIAVRGLALTGLLSIVVHGILIVVAPLIVEHRL